MPRLRILAGSSMSDLVPIRADSGVPVKVSSDAFEGQLAVFIKGFVDEDGTVRDSDYFRKRSGVTWSIQMQGRFLKEYTADDLLFGNIFDRPLKLPWVFSVAVKFMNFIDPTLEHDLASSSKPWALSPLIATMPYFEHKRIESRVPVPPFPPQEPIEDDTTQLRAKSTSGKGVKQKDSPSKRRGYFTNALRRQEIVFGPDDLITTDFCYDFLTFTQDGIFLKLPGGLSVEMTKYWDGQPVRFVCCERLKKRERTAEQAWGRVLWCVVIEPAGDDDVDSVREKGSTKSGSSDTICHGLGLDLDLDDTDSVMLHRGYEVWIADSHKRRLPEYKVKVGEDDSILTCYIPSESGKQFSIRWKDHNGPAAHHTSMRALVDGVPAGSSHSRPGASGKRAGISTDSASVYHPFQFAALQTTDDDNALWTAGASDQLGVIELRVTHVRPDVRPDTFRVSTFDGVSRVHERSKKAGAHCVALGRAKPYGKQHLRVKTTLLDKHAPPFATFRFLYRPAALLQAQGIVSAPAVQGANTQQSKARASAAPSASQASWRGMSVLDKKKPTVKSELQDTSIHVPGGGGDVIELSDDDDDDTPQRRPTVKRDPERRATYDPDDVIDLTLD
ncbi:hypothetical protein L226DRAFT_507615 [Lentinus tigrinus ALCF2SS1-7]|uniref:uncharacterized protein n=1 Tax=Lentinus tigrinus ALCF2SS1-7 TaxID=1328758 RepID=UPI001165FCB9|nr:hypothetical protein L226DRAFT_507615 [Lentinus tigrinus ALCF2SS1-7]